jgi:hypothetical protein
VPNRILRESILDSETVDRLGPAEEVFYRRLMSAVDDFGRFDARPGVLRSRLYPLRKSDVVTDDHVAAWLATCAAAGLVSLYQVAGKPYLTLEKFRQHVRARGSKYPDPPDDATRPRRTCDAPARSENNGRAAAHDEQGTRSYSYSDSKTDSEAQAQTDSVAATGDTGGAWAGAFEKFRTAYPKADGLAEARVAWARLDPGPAGVEELLAAILAGVTRATRSATWQREEGRYVPRAARWLADRAWEKLVKRPRHPPPPAGPGEVLDGAGAAAAWRAVRLHQAEA